MWSLGWRAAGGAKLHGGFAALDGDLRQAVVVAAYPKHIDCIYEPPRPRSARERHCGPGVGRAGVPDGRAVRKEREYEERDTRTPLRGWGMPCPGFC